MTCTSEILVKSTNLTWKIINQKAERASVGPTIARKKDLDTDETENVLFQSKDIKYSVSALKV